MKQYFGIDIGGTAVKLGIVDETGAVLAKAEDEMMQREGFSMTYDQLYNGENALKNAVATW